MTQFIENDISFSQVDPDNLGYVGVVVDNNDPTFSGRAKVRIFGLMDNIPVAAVPWATQMSTIIFGSDGGGSLSVPKLGQLVRIMFDNSDIYSPTYLALQNIDNQLIEKIKDDYLGTQVLIYDMDANLSIIYQPASGLQIFFKDSFFQISPDSLITLQTPNNDSIIQMEGDITRVTTKNEVQISGASKVTITGDEAILKGNQTTKLGPGPYNHSVSGEPLIALLMSMATIIDAKMSPTPGVTTALVQSAKQAILSTNVLVSQ
jgi:Type VI secretion system/phage-baseplate injector OB domain